MFALFMDYVVFPIYWLVFPSFRKHQRYVRVQNAHLSGEVHVVPDPNCWYCKAREDDRHRHHEHDADAEDCTICWPKERT